jgi:ectoine hydroxylase-related dioxygenase (phytanoyl-CoA dioxygenase family)
MKWQTAIEMTYPLLLDERLNTILHETGFVVLPLLNDEEINELTEFYEKIHQLEVAPFTTFAADNFNYKKSVSTKIQSVLKRGINQYFRDCELFWGNFFEKQAGSLDMPLHADLQYVDETIMSSYNIWCPLTDTTEQNGTLGVIPYSHLLVKKVRGINITDAYRKNAKAIAEKYTIYPSLKAGEAIVYNHRLLHNSAANTSQKKRLAATLIILEPNSSVLHYYAEHEGDTNFYKYNIDAVEDLMKIDFMQKPSHLLPSEIIRNYNFEPLKVEDFDSLFFRIKNGD